MVRRMALVTDINCKSCGETKHEVTDHSGVCQECRRKIASKARRVHLAGLRGMTPEERLERIEAQLYDFDTERRLRAIEASHTKYA